MRDLSSNELSLVNGGFGGKPPLGSQNASSYFGACMNYTSPNGTTGAVLTLAANLPFVGAIIGGLAIVHAIGTVSVCGLGTLQYAQ